MRGMAGAVMRNSTTGYPIARRFRSRGVRYLGVGIPAVESKRAPKALRSADDVRAQVNPSSHP